MKKSLLTFLSLLILGVLSFTAKADWTEKVVCSDTYPNTNRLLNLSLDWSGSQSLYVSNLPTSTTGKYSIKEIFFPYFGSTQPTNAVAHITLYAASGKSSSNMPLSEGDYTVVYDGDFDFSQANGGVRFTLQTPIEMENGQSLALGLLCHFISGTRSDINTQQCLVADGEWCQIVNADNISSVAGSDGSISGLVVYYTETPGGGGEDPGPGPGPTPEPVVDLAITEFDAPFGVKDYFINQPYEFSLTVKNLGEERVDAGTWAVEITDENGTVLGSNTNTQDISAGDWGNSQWPRVSVTFTEPGEKTLIAKAYVIGKEDNNPLDNEMTKTVKVITNAYSSTGLTISPAEDLSEGATVTLSANVTNLLSSELSGYTVSFYVSNAGSPAMLIAEHADNEAIAEGGSLNVTAEYTFPGGGEYSFYAVIAKEGLNPLQTPSVACTVAAGPEPEPIYDLAVTEFDGPFGVQNFYIDQPYDFSLTVKNYGEAVVTSGTWYVEITDAEDNVLATTYPSSDLGIGDWDSTQWPKVSLTFTEPGEKTLTAKAFVVGKEDNNPVDNVITKTIKVVANDYTSTGVTIDPTTDLTIGSTVTVSGDVTNCLSTELTDYQVDFYVSHAGRPGVLVQSITDTPAIPAEGNTSLSVNYTFPMGGEYAFYIVISKEDRVSYQSTSAACNVTVDNRLPDVMSETQPTLEGAAHEYLYPLFDRQHVNASAQVIYPAEYFGKHRQAYQIQKLSLKAAKDDYQHIIPATPIRIYLAQTDRTAGFVKGAVEIVPREDFLLVYEGMLTAETVDDGFIYNFDLQRNFTLDDGKSLVLVTEFTSDGQSLSPEILFQNTGEDYYMTYTYNTSKDLTDFNVWNARDYSSNFVVRNTLPCLTLTYALEALPEIVDLEATSLTVPDGDENYANSALTFRVNLANPGTVTIDDYKIELLNCADEANPVVLETFEGRRTISADATAIDAVKYTFAQPGDYKLAARVIVEGDVNLENNTTPVVNFVVKEEKVEVTDLAATTLTVPTGDDNSTGKELAFTVALTNAGTVEVADYEVELLNCADAANPVVLTKVNGASAIAAGATATQEVKYVFETAGDYKLAARVVVAGDNNAANDITPVVDFTVKQTVDIDSVIAEGTLSFDSTTSVLSVNVGEGIVAVVDLSGRLVARYEVKGATKLHLNLTAGIYVVTANGKTLKIRF